MSEDRMDERLRRYGQRWREQQPMSGPVPGGFADRRRRSPGPWLAVAAVAAIAVIAGVTWAARPAVNETPATPSSPTVSPSSPPVSTSPTPSTSPDASSSSPSSTSPSTSPTSSAAAVPACLGSQLSAEMGPHGPTAGTEHILILLHNTSDRTCTLGGLPTLTGVRADGTTSALGFHRTSDVAYIVLTTIGPGPVPPGGRGGINVSEGLDNCPKLETFATLRITLEGGQRVEMPWPAEMSRGCAGSQGPAGLLPAGPLRP